MQSSFSKVRKLIFQISAAAFLLGIFGSALYGLDLVESEDLRIISLQLIFGASLSGIISITFRLTESSSVMKKMSLIFWLVMTLIFGSGVGGSAKLLQSSKLLTNAYHGVLIPLSLAGVCLLVLAWKYIKEEFPHLLEEDEGQESPDASHSTKSEASSTPGVLGNKLLPPDRSSHPKKG